MSVEIKVGIARRATRPANWADVVTELLWAALAIVFAYPLTPMLVERNDLGSAVAVFISSTFGVVAVLHLYDAFRITRGLNKQKASL